jgi:hypothetical protein
MRLRFFVPLGLLALGALLAPACSGDDDGDTAARTSEERDSSGDGDSGDSDSSDSGDSGSDDTGIQDLDDLADELPDMGEFEDCFQLAATYSSLYLEALGGEDGARDAQNKAEELKDQLPDDLHDDIDVVADAIGEVAEEGLLSGSAALETPEYQEADQAITDHLEQECGG